MKFFGQLTVNVYFILTSNFINWDKLFFDNYIFFHWPIKIKFDGLFNLIFTTRSSQTAHGCAAVCFRCGSSSLDEIVKFT